MALFFLSCRLNNTMLSMPVQSGRVFYLVLRSGYPKEDPCWVEEKDVTCSLVQYAMHLFKCRLFYRSHYHFFSREFKSPNPPMRLVLDSVSLMIFHIQRSLAAGKIRRNKVCMFIATDVFRFLFDGKGVDVGRGYKEYNLTDFSTEYFVDGWHVNFDENGDGCAINFPLRMKCCVQLEKGFVKTQGETIPSRSPRLFVERVYLYVVKERV